MKPFINRQTVASIHYSDFHGLSYVSNRKSGCTSIKYSLWTDYDKKTGQKTFKGNSHDYRKSPFVKFAVNLKKTGLNKVDSSKFFTVVRNPYARILSAYLHKVHCGNLTDHLKRNFVTVFKKEASWKGLCKQAGINRFSSISFIEFLRHVKSVSPIDLGPHFRTQCLNISYGAIGYDFIGYIEQQQDLAAYLSTHHIDMKIRAHHGKNAQDQILHYYCDEAISLVQEIYLQDFEQFGYSKDISKATEAGSGFTELKNNHLIGDFLHSIAGTNEQRIQFQNKLKSIILTDDF